MLNYSIKTLSFQDSMFLTKFFHKEILQNQRFHSNLKVQREKKRGGGNMSHTNFSHLKSCKVDLIFSSKYGSDSLGANSHHNFRCTISSSRCKVSPPGPKLTFLIGVGICGVANSCRLGMWELKK